MHLYSPVADAAVDLSARTWSILDDAIDQAVDLFAVREPASRMAALGASLRTCVREAVLGKTPVIDADGRQAPAVRLVEFVRRALIDRGRSEAGFDPHEMMRLLNALGEVQLQLDQDVGDPTVEALAGPDGRELVIEVAHDMRSPLAAILFLVDMMLRGRSGTLTDLQERQLGLIYGAAFGLSQVASDLIELARGGERLVDRYPVPFSVSELLHSIRDIVQPIAEERGLTITVQGPAEDGRLGYPAALTRVLLNLATNALKFTPEGAVTIHALERSRSKVEFSVQDSGNGVPEDVLRSMFAPFRSVRGSESRRFSQAGLGLSICQRLLRLMGTDLGVDTRRDFGTRFHFTLDLPLAGRS